LPSFKTFLSLIHVELGTRRLAMLVTGYRLALQPVREKLHGPRLPRQSQLDHLRANSSASSVVRLRAKALGNWLLAAPAWVCRFGRLPSAF
jgi:hypothetical protein